MVSGRRGLWVGLAEALQEFSGRLGLPLPRAKSDFGDALRMGDLRFQVTGSDGKARMPSVEEILNEEINFESGYIPVRGDVVNLMIIDAADWEDINPVSEGELGTRFNSAKIWRPDLKALISQHVPENEVQVPDVVTRNKGGAPARYDWDALDREIVGYLIGNGPPPEYNRTKLAQCVHSRLMARGWAEKAVPDPEGFTLRKRCAYWLNVARQELETDDA